MSVAEGHGEGKRLINRYTAVRRCLHNHSMHGPVNVYLTTHCTNNSGHACKAVKGHHSGEDSGGFGQEAVPAVY